MTQLRKEKKPMFVVASRALNPIMLIHLLGYCNSVGLSGATSVKKI